MAYNEWDMTESNPEAMNRFIRSLGVPSEWEFHDVWGLDEELLQMVPKPVVALLLLFPKRKGEPPQKQQTDRAETSSTGPYFMKQVVYNTCGVISILHALANNSEIIRMEPSAFLGSFFESTKFLSPEEKGLEFERRVYNSDSGRHGNPSVQNSAGESDDFYLHYITLVEKEGKLFELDGCKTSPVEHGSTSQETFFQDACNVCRKFMQRDPNNVNFTIIALAKRA